MIDRSRVGVARAAYAQKGAIYQRKRLCDIRAPGIFPSLVFCMSLVW